MRQSIRPAVQLRIRQRGFFVHHRRSLGAFPHLLLKQLLDALLLRILRLRLVPLIQHLSTLRLGQYGQPVYHLLLVSHHPLQQSAKIPQVSINGRGLEQRGGVLNPAHDALSRLRQRERQIELRYYVRCRPKGTYFQPRKYQPAHKRVLPSKHHLKHRTVRQTPHRPYNLHHLLKRYVLMLLRAQRLLLHPLQQPSYRRRARNIQPQR